MKMLWNIVNKLDINTDTKNKLYIGALIIVNMLIGALVWFVLNKTLNCFENTLICFIGYPGLIIGLFGGTIYLYNHNFD